MLKQNINSILRPTLIDSYIFTVSENGYLFIIDNKKGNWSGIIDRTPEWYKPKIKIQIENSRYKG